MSFPERKPDASAWKVCDLNVDLGKEYDAALYQQLPFLKVFGDVVRVPEDFAKTIGGYKKPSGGYLRHIQIIARRLEIADNKGRVRINPPAEGDLVSTVSLLLGEIVSGRFQIDKINYDSSDKQSVGDSADAAAAGINDDLCYMRYSSESKDGQLGKRALGVGETLLQPGEPLHELFTESYARAASLTGEPIPADAESWVSARQIFDWLARWTKYPSEGKIGQSEIAFFAESLTRVLPSLSSGNSTVYAIPPRPSRAYLDDLKTQVEQARQIEASLVAARNKSDLKGTFNHFVTTLTGRDTEDLRELDVLILAATRRVESANASVWEAADKITDLQLEAKLNEIKYQTERAVQAIWDTVTAVWQVVYGLYQVVTGVADGLAAFRAAGALRTVGQIPTLMRNFLGGVAASDEGLKSKAFYVVYTVGYLPYSEMYHAWNSVDKDSRASLIGGIKSGVPSLLTGGGKLNSLYLKDKPDVKDLNAIASLVSDATQAFGVVKAKAAWDTFQVDMEKRLDPVIAADNSDVSKAARELKATLNKLIIGGKLLAEQQATLTLANRELGTLILRKSTIRRSQALFNELKDKLGTDEERNELLIRAANAKLLELKQSFFAKTWEYKAAYFYECGRWPKQAAMIPQDATAFGSIYSKLDTESKSAPKRNSLDVTIVIDDQEVLTKLRETGEAPFVISFKDAKLSNYQMIRLRELVPVIEGVKSKQPGKGHTISLTSAANYWDRINDEVRHWQGRPSSVSFTYDADGSIESQPYPFDQSGEAMPSPFTEWTVKLGKAADLDLTGVSKLSLKLIKADAVPGAR